MSFCIFILSFVNSIFFTKCSLLGLVSSFAWFLHGWHLQLCHPLMQCFFLRQWQWSSLEDDDDESVVAISCSASWTEPLNQRCSTQDPRLGGCQIFFRFLEGSQICLRYFV